MTRSFGTDSGLRQFQARNTTYAIPRGDETDAVFGRRGQPEPISSTSCALRELMRRNQPLRVRSADAATNTTSRKKVVAQGNLAVLARRPYEILRIRRTPLGHVDWTCR